MLDGEVENRFLPFLGFGGDVVYAFAKPPVFLASFPEIFIHPMGRRWFISAAPSFEFGRGMHTHIGAKLGTRIPIPLPMLTLMPGFSVEVFKGRTVYVLGLCVQLGVI